VRTRKPVIYIARDKVIRAAGLGRRRISIMARGREKDRKTRKKHRKNVQRMKGLVKARRAAAKKAKR
jgi:hypothetical protein